MGNVRFDFAGKVALVTGGASLLGATIARAFHATGAAVVIAAVDGGYAMLGLDQGLGPKGWLGGGS